MTRSDVVTRSPARAATGMGVATAVSRSFGFVRILVIAAVLGTTYLGNTFQASNSVSNVLFDLLAGGALSAVLVPTFVTLLDQGNTRETERLAGGLLGLALVGLGAVTVVGALAAPWIARALASGVKDPRIAAEQTSLATFLLRFFIPQVILYAWGAIAIALLYARRRLAITAAAPIGNTVFIVGGLALFAWLRGGVAPSLDLTLAEKLALALAGTLGVAAFVGIPVIALWREKVSLRPRWPGRDPAVGRLLRLSGWAVFQYSASALLLGAAIVVGGAVEGGVVAYQIAWVFFLAPYAVLAQPVHTAILPEISREADAGDMRAFTSSLRWTLDAMAVLVVPVSAAAVALSLPAMHVVSFGRATASGGVHLTAAALAALALGLFPYGAFLLFARAYYALGDSRTPAIVAVVSAAIGIAVMVVGAAAFHGVGLVAMLGLGHTAAQAIGAVWLGVGLSRRTGHSVAAPALARVVVLSVVVGVGAWAVSTALGHTTRTAALILVLACVAVGGVVYLVALRALGGGQVRLHPRSPIGS